MSGLRFFGFGKNGMAGLGSAMDILVVATGVACTRSALLQNAFGDERRTPRTDEAAKATILQNEDDGKRELLDVRLVLSVAVALAMKMKADVSPHENTGSMQISQNHRLQFELEVTSVRFFFQRETSLATTGHLVIPGSKLLWNFPKYFGITFRFGAN